MQSHKEGIYVYSIGVNCTLSCFNHNTKKKKNSNLVASSARHSIKSDVGIIH
jgi:hypothetical protein